MHKKNEQHTGCPGINTRVPDLSKFFRILMASHAVVYSGSVIWLAVMRSLVRILLSAETKGRYLYLNRRPYSLNVNRVRIHSVEKFRVKTHSYEEEWD